MPVECSHARQINEKLASFNVLQKTLKEKEEHIEQLLKERDMERSEVVRAAAQVDEVGAPPGEVPSSDEGLASSAKHSAVRTDVLTLYPMTCVMFAGGSTADVAEAGARALRARDRGKDGQLHRHDRQPHRGEEERSGQTRRGKTVRL